jgi:hypothetical protein
MSLIGEHSDDLQSSFYDVRDEFLLFASIFDLELILGWNEHSPSSYS